MLHKPHRTCAPEPMRTFRSNNARRREALTGYLFLLPSLIGVCVLLVFPMADTVRRSFLSVSEEWRGLENYRTLFRNASFRLAAGNTARFLVIAIPLLLLLSLGAALVVKRAPAFAKSSFLVPLALPVAALALLWRLLFDDHGLVNAAMGAMSMGTVSFLNSGASFWVLVGSYIWKNVGFDMVLILAALTNVPKSLYEAAQLDGAGPFQQFCYITLPHLYPTLFVTAVLSVINAFKVFREAYLVAGNYPHERMYLLQHLFNNWFLRLDVDKLCAAATLTALVLAALILLLQKFWGEVTHVRRIGKFFWIGICVVLCVTMLFPLAMLLVGSLMGNDEAFKVLGPVFSGTDGYASWPLLPQYPTLRGYIELTLDRPEFFAMFWNSVSYAVLSLLGQLVGVGAAWSFARYRFPFKKAIFALYVFLMLMPFQVTMIGQYLSLDALHLMDTRWAIVLPMAFSTLPVFIMTRFFEVIPNSMLEAARIDGAGELRIFLRIGLPLGFPGLLSAMVLGFIEIWGMIEQPMTFLRSQQLWPLSLYLPQITEESLGWAMTASTIALLPPLLVFLCGQRYLVQGIGTMGLREG